MNLEDQISIISNPQEFTRLCNAIFTAEYGGEFQVIDGTRSDEGNDGYVISEKRVIAIYCPIKPERKTDADYIDKIRSDLRKASVLQESGKYEVQKWTFLTPRKLSSNIIAALRGASREVGITGNHQEATYLAGMLCKHRHILQEFPGLFLPDIDNKLDEIIALLKARLPEKMPTEEEMDKNHFYKAKPVNKDELERVIGLRKNPGNGKIKADLYTIYYTSSDQVIKLNALLGVLDRFEPIKDSADDMAGLCDEGILIARQVNADSVRAYLLAQKGFFISFIYSFLDIQTAYQIIVSNTIGVLLINEEDRQTVMQKLWELERNYENLFGEAMDIIKQNYDFSTLCSILISIGSAAGMRAIYLENLSITERAASERQKCRRTLTMAKDIYECMQDDLGKANALFNLANQIRFFGQGKEASILVEGVIEVAKEYGDEILMQKAESLKETLKTGKIPNYLGCEGLN
jgi:hypothetical protein